MTVTIKRASDPMISLIKSAIANAKANFSLKVEDLFVKSLTVDNGAILYRRMPRARGMAYPIRKRTSHICHFGQTTLMLVCDASAVRIQWFR